MSAIVVQSDQLHNRELQRLVEKTTEILKLSIVQGINGTMNPSVYKFRPKELTLGGKDSKKYPSTALVVANRVKTFNPQQVKALRLALGRDASITSAIRNRGIDMRSKKSIVEQVNTKKLFAFVNEANFNETAMQGMIRNLSLLPESNVMPARSAAMTDLRVVDAKFGQLLPANWLDDLLGHINTGSGNVSPNKDIRFRVREVKCIDETNPEWLGSDEISLGGVVVDDKEELHEVPERFVGDGFDDGERRIYSPPEIIKFFPLDNDYPKAFLATVAIAEKDSEGMSKFIRELYEAIKADVNLIVSILGKAAGVAIAAGIGGSVGTAVGGPLGAIIGIIAGAVLGALVAWLSDTLQDDIFPTQVSTAYLESEYDAFADGSLVSPRQYLHFRDHGGHYRVTCDWLITR